MAFGHFMMASEALLFPALLLLIFGGGFFKTNTTAQVGHAVSSRAMPAATSAYSIFYVGINLGAFLAPLVCGTLGEKVGWHYGFAAAGVGMLLALAIYLAGWKHLPPDGSSGRRQSRRAQPLTAQEWKSVGALLLLVIPLTLWWACYEQQGNTIALFADRQYRPPPDPGPDRLANSRDLVPVLQSLHDLRLHAVR